MFGAGTGDRWALVLAAGEGTRLAGLTSTGDGGHVPKQFCSFCSDRSLLAQTVARAGRLVSRERVVVVVAAQHRALWEPELAELPADNVVVQPRNLGTANGLLLGAMAVARRDPAATLLILPSDHAFENERRLRIALRRAQMETIRHPRELVLLGIEPEEPDTEYGWILPAAAGDGLTSGVAGFVEKPDAASASRLMAEGAVWSSFIMACRLAALLGLYQRRQPGILRAFADACGEAQPALEPRLRQLYEALPPCDFSRDLLQQGTESLRLMRVPEIGWSDLGTPERLLRCLRRRRLARAPASRPGPAARRAPLALEAGLLAATA